MDKDSGDSQGQGAANAVHEDNKHFIFNPRHLEALFLVIGFAQKIHQRMPPK